MTSPPEPSRPFMPDYGVLPADEGSGLLAWAWAAAQLHTSTNFWVSTRWPDGRPHVVPVWGVWDGEAVWFSGGLRSRKIRNLMTDGRCSIAIEDASNPVVIEGTAHKVDDDDRKQGFLDLVNVKYETSYGLDFLDPATTAVMRIAPSWAFGMRQDDFSGSPTRWNFA